MQKTTKKLVLALGESTHTHIMTSKSDIDYRDLGNESISFLLKGTGVITHEEHDRIVLPAGSYVKVNQVEYDPFLNEVVRVFD